MPAGPPTRAATLSQRGQIFLQPPEQFLHRRDLGLGETRERRLQESLPPGRRFEDKRRARRSKLDVELTGIVSGGRSTDQSLTVEIGEYPRDRGGLHRCRMSKFALRAGAELTDPEQQPPTREVNTTAVFERCDQRIVRPYHARNEVTRFGQVHHAIP